MLMKQKKLYNETDIESKKNYDFVMKQEDLKYEGRHLADLIEILKKKKKEKPWIFNKKYYDDKIDEYTKRIEEINVLMLKKGDFENNGHKLANIECDLIDFRKDKNVLSAKTKKEIDKLMQRGGQVIPSEIIRDIIIKIYRNKYQIALFKLNEIKERHYTYMYNRIKKDPKEFFARHDMINFGFKLATEYKGIKNLKLTADGLFGGRHHFEYDRELKYPAYTMGYVKLHAGAKYDFKLLNDKLVVSPEGNITATFADIYAGICDPSLVLAPKVSLEYKPIEELKVKGSVEVPVRFGLNEFNEFGYKNTSIKGALNMRYEWK